MLVFSTHHVYRKEGMAEEGYKEGYDGGYENMWPSRSQSELGASQKGYEEGYKGYKRYDRYDERYKDRYDEIPINKHDDKKL